MIDKYRVHEVAKDFGVQSKDVLALLEGRFPDAQRKHMTALSDAELNFLFDHYTALKQIDNFDDYFEKARASRAAEQATATPAVETAKPAEPVREPKKEAPKQDTQKPAGQSQPREQRPSDRNAQGDRNRDRQGGQGRPQGQGQQGGQRQQGQQGGQGGQGQRRNDSRPNDSRSGQPAAAAKPSQPQKGTPPRTAPQPAGGGDTATRGGSHVDMRSASVDLEKYNERYEQIATTSVAPPPQKETPPKKPRFGGRNNRRPTLSRKEQEIERNRRQELERQRRQNLEVELPEEISVGDLALKLKVQASEIVKRLMAIGVMASVGNIIDYDTAALVAMEIGAKVEREVVVTIEDRLFLAEEEDTANNVSRDPVVVVMGHVDHGKTSLLDAIRKTNVTASEAGGITQHIGAYSVSVDDRAVTFLDTPGHAAFTSMRARGAQVTDIAVLVVAADDGIMPQTVEAINHAKAAGVTIIVAINKIDKDGANPDRVKTELTNYELVWEEWGGDTICVPVSAITGEGIDTLLEMIILVADMMELKANPERPARGTIIEAKLDKGRGPVATVLVQNGSLKSGDLVIAGTAVGRVRVMQDDKGRRIDVAGPSSPVEITGLGEVPGAGDILNVVSDERLAKELVEQRRFEAKEEQFKAYQKVTLDNLFSQISQGDIKELPIIVKADVGGSVEAVRQSLEKLSNAEVRVRVIHGGVGAVSESDVMLANASNAIIVGFNVRPDPVAAASAARDSVELRLYRIIYDAINEIESAINGMLAPKFRDVELGRAEVRAVYKITGVGAIAGCYVLDGKITRSANIRVVRDGIIVADDKLDSLKRFKDDVREVATGYECGMGLTKFSDIKEGDVFEAYVVEEYKD